MSCRIIALCVDPCPLHEIGGNGGLNSYHTQLSRWSATLAVKIPRRPGSEPVHVVVGPTRMKISGEGEWKVRQHGVGKRRT